ncbi:MAG TPA: CidA/LrgA family protein [Longimicrobiaceae bacterium]|nr:CidA/LrgA family protein [Longimicrobiaceae bacterium]
MTRALHVLLSLLVILVFLYAGEALVRLSGVPVPGSVAGMVLLTLALRLRLLPERAVRPAADLLLRHMALLFVPPGVGLMLYFALIRAQWPAIVGGGLAGAVAVLVVVGLLQQRLERAGD